MKFTNYRIVNWEKPGGILQSLDTGRTWYELRVEDKTQIGFCLFAESIQGGIIIEVEDSGDGMITISDFLGKVICNEPVHIYRGKNVIKLPSLLSRSGVYFATINLCGKNYNFPLIIL